MVPLANAFARGGGWSLPDSRAYVILDTPTTASNFYPARLFLTTASNFPLATLFLTTRYPTIPYYPTLSSYYEYPLLVTSIPPLEYLGSVATLLVSPWGALRLYQYLLDNYPLKHVTYLYKTRD